MVDELGGQKVLEAKREVRREVQKEVDHKAESHLVDQIQPEELVRRTLGRR